ncbi:MAG: response regulator transcription factor [Clostridia bacterium]|nr:response regulator transcription factor [Clostridia bacterium]
MNILFAEDDKSLNNLVSSFLSSLGYKMFCCFDGEQALEIFSQNKIDIVLSDIMMPKLDGFCLAEKIRQQNNQIPILFLTAKDDKMSKQFGYRVGIDDYITKPFDIDELGLKISAIARRLNIEQNKTLVVGNTTLDKEEHTAYVDGEELNLTVREFDILFKLLSYPKKTFTRSNLMNEFWDYDSSATSRTVDVYMAKLREKTQQCDGFEIITVHGLGYKVVLREK